MLALAGTQATAGKCSVAGMAGGSERTGRDEAGAPGKPTVRCLHIDAGRNVAGVFPLLFCLNVGASKYVYKTP